MGVGCGVAAFLGSEMVLSPVVSAVSLLQGVGVGCGVAAFLGFDMVLSPVVSAFSLLRWRVGVGCGVAALWSWPLDSLWLLSCAGVCWLVWPLSWAFKLS